MAYKYETNAKLLDELMGTGRNQDRVVEVIEVCAEQLKPLANSATT